MSIFSSLFSKTAAQRKPGLPVPQAAVAPPHVPTSNGGPQNELKQHRQDRRDHLYTVVRDVMLRSEVLASNYKFKVLSLDTQGRQFMIMMDLFSEQCLGPEQLANLESLISSTAAQRYALLVKAVYWRQTESVKVPNAASTAVGTGAPAAVSVVATTPPPPPATPHPSAVAVIQDVAAPLPRGRGGIKVQGFEPIGPDEVLAFKKAIAAGPGTASPSGEARISGLRNAAAMSGFEDTQLLEPDTTVSPLSKTQFGDFV